MTDLSANSFRVMPLALAALLTATAVQAQSATAAPNLLAPNLERLYFSNFDNLGTPTVGEMEQLPGLAAPARNLGPLTVQYQGGSSAERAAEIARDPLLPNNSVLLYRVSSPNVRDANGRPERGRVQLNAYGARCLREVAVQVRMLLLPQLAAMRDVRGRFDWFTISEWWNNADWTPEGNAFRISVNITKTDSAPGSEVYFQVAGQTRIPAEKNWNAEIWKELNTSFPIPFGKWITLQYYFKEGDRDTGRFMMNASVDGGPLQRIFDIKNYTQSPTDKSPNGLTQINPIKVYTSAQIVDAIKSLGGDVRVAWDDLDIRANPATSGCR